MPPAWELNRIPGWEQGNVARALLDRDRRRSSKHNDAPQVIYVVPPYPYFPNSFPAATQFFVTAPPPTSAAVAQPHEPPPPPVGVLRLEAEPRDAIQVFVDGIYLGRLIDIGDEILLKLGVRRIELRAPGYRTLVFDTEIVTERTVVYRGQLEAVAAAPAPAPTPKAPLAPEAPKAPTRIFVIPGCYMGNVSPKEVALPAGCDIRKLTTVTP